MNIPGVSVHRESWRFYPGGRTAAHVLGFIAYQGDIIAGRYGIERYYNDILSRESEGAYTNFFAELFSNITEAIVRGENEREGDIVLTIEPNVEKQLEEKLRVLKSAWGSDIVRGASYGPCRWLYYCNVCASRFDLNAFGEKDPAIFVILHRACMKWVPYKTAHSGGP
jgi:hypothetical protein